MLQAALLSRVVAMHEVRPYYCGEGSQAADVHVRNKHDKGMCSVWALSLWLHDVHSTSCPADTRSAGTRAASELLLRHTRQKRAQGVQGSFAVSVDAEEAEDLFAHLPQRPADPFADAVDGPSAEDALFGRLQQGRLPVLIHSFISFIHYTCLLSLGSGTYSPKCVSIRVPVLVAGIPTEKQLLRRSVLVACVGCAGSRYMLLHDKRGQAYVRRQAGNAHEVACA